MPMRPRAEYCDNVHRRPLLRAKDKLPLCPPLLSSPLPLEVGPLNTARRSGGPL